MHPNVSAHRPALVFFLALFVNGLVVWSLAPDEIFEQALFRIPTYLASQSFESGDFNGDGKRDLAVADQSGKTISIYLGKGNGSFAPPSQLPVAGWAIELAVADFNSDGAQDLALNELILDTSSVQISIVLGNGDGTFRTERLLSVEAVAHSLTTGDFNGDGRTDLVAPRDSRKIVVLLGTGDGTFSSPRDFDVSALLPWSIAVGDLNEDGVQDLVVGNYYSNSSISVLLGIGDGTFQAEILNPATTTEPSDVALGDFNGDGHLDVATSNNAGNTGLNVAVFLGLGNGLLGEKIGVNSGIPNALQISVGDFDRDGRQDLAVTQAVGGSEVSLCRGSGDGHFTRYGAIGTDDRPAQTVFDDFTGDGVADAAILALNADVIRVVPGTGTGSFAPRTRGDAGAPPDAVAPADVNGDGRVDLITANSVSNDVSVMLGHGDGTFDPAARYAAGIGPVSVAVSDVNADGSLDIVTADAGSRTVSVLLGSAGGGFGAPTQFPAGSSANIPQSVAVGDLGNDGKPDLIVANAGFLSHRPQPPSPFVSPGFVSVLDGIGDGTFASQRTFSGGPDPRFVATGDFNGDGWMDIAVTTWLTLSPTETDVWILWGSEGGVLAGSSPVATGYKAASIAVGDFNTDGRQDIAVAQSATNQFQNASHVGIALGNGDGTFLPLIQYATTFDSRSVVTADFDHDGRLDLAVANTLASDVSVLLGAGDGTFGPQASYPVSKPVFLAVADSNGDSGPDLLAASPLSSSVWVLQNLSHPPLSIIDITVNMKSPLGRGSGTIQWSTVREDDVKGFNVIVIGNAARTAINPTLITCEQCVTGLGHTYAFYIPKHKSARDLFIEAVHVDGSVEVFGPAVKLHD